VLVVTGVLPHDAAPLVPFRPGPHAPAQPEWERDLGIALARLAGRSPPAARSVVGAMAADRLNASLGVWRGDAPAWLALSIARGVRGEGRERLEAATKAAALSPHSDGAFSELAEAAVFAKRLPEALDAANKLVERNPRSVDFFLVRAFVWQRMQDWEKAEADCRAALKIHPLHPKAHLYLGICRQRRGDVAEAARERDLALKLATSQSQRDGFLDWFERESR
jgi:tetratricopeptide (TPR) repeat protein